MTRAEISDFQETRVEGDPITDNERGDRYGPIDFSVSDNARPRDPVYVRTLLLDFLRKDSTRPSMQVTNNPLEARRNDTGKYAFVDEAALHRMVYNDTFREKLAINIAGAPLTQWIGRAGGFARKIPEDIMRGFSSGVGRAGGGIASAFKGMGQNIAKGYREYMPAKPKPTPAPAPQAPAPQTAAPQAQLPPAAPTMSKALPSDLLTQTESAAAKPFVRDPLISGGEMPRAAQQAPGAMGPGGTHVYNIMGGGGFGGGIAEALKHPAVANLANALAFRFGMPGLLASSFAQQFMKPEEPKKSRGTPLLQPGI